MVESWPEVVGIARSTSPSDGARWWHEIRRVGIGSAPIGWSGNFTEVRWSYPWLELGGGGLGRLDHIHQWVRRFGEWWHAVVGW